MKPVIDPRRGDVEDDASSTKRRSLLSLAGSLLAEISFPKLILSWTMLFVVPGLLLGLAPLIASAWVTMVSRKIASPLLGIWPVLLLVTLLAIGFFGARALFRMAESNFWSLNSLWSAGRVCGISSKGFCNRDSTSRSLRRCELAPQERRVSSSLPLRWR